MVHTWQMPSREEKRREEKRREEKRKIKRREATMW
jgi:hypothetical protein